MHEAIQAHFQGLEDALRTTAVPADRQEVIAASVQRLAALYAQFRQTNDGRYGEQISRLVQGVLNDLQACPQARKMDAPFREGLRLLHEELGVPGLTLKPAPPPPSPRKARKKR